MFMERNELYPEYTREVTKIKESLAPEIMEAWRGFSRTVLKEGALSAKIKQLIAVAVAHVTQCPYCIQSHTKQALKKGATREEIMEAIWVAAEMRAGAASSHAAIAIDIMEKEERRETGKD